ncbi:hypothetical protein [Kitasatospora sp. NPDC088783]|uniref:hypothetical protein n=1 Tax=Kitasatospora sp. NPDC088783 TaxID=3364077 RepID=UPI0037F84D4C
MTPVVSVAVAGGTARPEAVAALTARLRGLGPVRVVRGDPASVPVRAWRAAATTGSTHHLVVRDTAELAPAFTAELARAVAGHPRSALALHVEPDSWNAGAARLAALRGCGWAAAVPQDCLPPTAVLLPSDLALAFSGFADAALAAGGSPDGLLPEFARRHRLDTLVHAGGLATLRAAPGAPPRPSAEVCAGPSERPFGGPLADRVSPLPEVLPRLHAGRARISLWDPAASTWRRASWSRYMARSGRNWPGAAPAAAFVAITDRPPPAERERVLPLTEVVRYGLALGTVLGRAPAETSALELRPCLCGAVLDAAGPVPARDWPDAWTDELTDVLWRAVGVGARLRAHHGVERWPPEELRDLPAEEPPCGGPGTAGPSHRGGRPVPPTHCP